eukprot:GILJ01034506.1.p1 GENE.GILJ01034506.1~~GILJ01034506.1.p1  ORF type:complete len:222 (+),score=13.39 GILJ01034506.1:32-667(+)
METTSSDLLFTSGSDVLSYAVSSAVLAATVLIGTLVAIVSVWLHLRTLQLPSILATCTFSLTIIFTIFWAGLMVDGRWDDHMRQMYMAKYWDPFVGPSADGTMSFSTLSSDQIRSILASDGIDRSHQLMRSARLGNLTLTCPFAVASLNCCGWNTTCPPSCGSYTTSCEDAAKSEASDFAVKIIVISTLILVLVGASSAITMWRHCSRAAG